MSQYRNKILFFSHIPIMIKNFRLGYMEFLREKGYIVEACASKDPIADFIKEKGFTYHEINIPRGIDPIGDLKALVSLVRLIKKEKYDLIHTQTSPAGFIGRLAGKLTGTKVIHTAHDWPFHSLLNPLIRWLYVFMERLAYNWCEAITVDTKAVKSYGAKYLPQDKVYQIYTGIDLKRFYPYSQEARIRIRTLWRLNGIVVGCVSRLVPDKGLETFIDCAKEWPTLLFVIVGDGPLRESLEKRAGANVLFTGYVSDTAPYYNAFDIFLLPTLREGFGTAFVEAEACGVPVIGRDIPVLREVAKGIFANHLEGFVVAIKTLLNPANREYFSRRGREHIKIFEMKKINEQLYELTKKVLNESKYSHTNIQQS